jgi:hypothetical protein
LEKIEYLEDFCEKLPRPWAVVGNGVAHIKSGKIIDSFPTIVRFNQYVIEGYEEFVGTKTTLRSVTWSPCWPQKIKNISPFSLKNDGLVVRPRKGTGTYGVYATSGYALLSLLNREKVETIVFHMDGLQSGHYWDTSHRHWNMHQGEKEWREIQKMTYVGVYKDSFEAIS